MKLKKVLIFTICSALIVNLSRVITHAAFPAAAGVALNVGGMVVGAAPQAVSLLDRFLEYFDTKKKDKEYRAEVEKYSGYRSKEEIANRLSEIIAGRSLIKIYGQDEAKKDCLRFLMTFIEEMFPDKGIRRQLKGNVLYIIGPPGTGKTVMAKAIADAFLKYPAEYTSQVEHTRLIISPERVQSSDSLSGDLGTRLFKTVISTENLTYGPQNAGFFKSVLGKKQSDQQAKGGTHVIVPAPVLYHLIKWNGNVVIILDDYDKMKVKIGYNGMPECDKSADEVFRSIISSGYYMMGADKIDCSKALFIITTNETREQINEQFGQGGAVGGAPGRLSIAEFKALDDKCGEKLVRDLISEVCSILTNDAGIYRIKSVEFPEDTVRRMIECIVNDKLKQGRAIDDLKSGILGVCAEKRSGFAYQPVEISYAPGGAPGKIGDFTVRVVKEEGHRVEKVRKRDEKPEDCDLEINSDDDSGYFEIASDDDC